MRVFTALAVSLAVIAVAMAVLAYQKRADEPWTVLIRDLESQVQSERQRTQELDAALGELHERMVSLSTAVQNGRSAAQESLPETSGASTPRDPELGSAQLEEFARRFDDIDERLRSLEETSRQVLAIGGTGRRTETVEELQAAVQKHQVIALDRERSVTERLGSLRSLRSRDGRSYEVTLGMIDLIQDPNVESKYRADIIRNLHGVDFEELKQPLLHILDTDGDPDTRSETVETLDVFYADPVVHEAVVRVRDNPEEDPRVRAEAAARLKQFEGRK